MIVVPARVQPACARIHYGRARFTFHHVSDPIVGALPTFQVPKARGGARI